MAPADPAVQVHLGRVEDGLQEREGSKMRQVTMEEAATCLPELIQEAKSGEEVIIMENCCPVVKIVPMISERRKPEFGSARGLIEIGEDFDEPLDEFREYM